MITLEQCLQLCNSQGWAESTKNYYRCDIHDFAHYWEAKKGQSFVLTKVSTRDLRAYQDNLQDERGLRASSVERKFAPLHFLFRQVLRQGWMSTNPMEGIKRIRQVEMAPRSLDKNEQAMLMRAIRQELESALRHYPIRWRTYQRDASLVIFLLNTGLRINETHSVKLDDFQLSERKGRLLVRRGKGRKERRIPLNLHARKALQEWLAVRPQSETNHLWTAVERSDTALSTRSMQRILSRYKKLAGLERFSPHICRHTFAKNLINEGVGLEKVAKLLGHANLNTTKIYITPSEEDLAEAVRTLG
jgi:integrase/recombinase XerC